MGEGKRLSSEIVSLRGCKPRRVHEQDNVHYFFWYWDLYKPFDYEPVIVHSHCDLKILLSRFHWHIGTIWTECIEEDDKPKVNFVRGVHTPIAESNVEELVYVEFDPDVPLNERIDIIYFYLPLFRWCRNSVKFTGPKKAYKNLIVQGKVPKKYLFKLSEIKSAVLIGRFPEPQELPEALKEKLEL